MAGLLDEQSKKRGLTRGTQIQTTNGLNLNSLKTDNNIQNPEPNRITEAVNIRVDNHIRNKITALSIIGYGETQKEVTDIIINDFINKLNREELKRYEDLINIYEDKDVAKWRKKNK